MRKRLIAGNWKMHSSRQSARELVTAVQAGLPADLPHQVVFAPPALWLTEVATLLSHPQVALAAQNVSEHLQGAYTGELAAPMLKEAGCSYVIVGHSERRSLYGEDNALVGRKTLTALQVGLTPISCIGETLSQRESGQTWDVLKAQLQGIAASLQPSDWAKLVLAYEPVWAIGTGRNATPEQAQEVHAQVRSWLRQQAPAAADTVQILYGGSVKPENATSLLSQTDIDGALVGGASLKANDFLNIILS
jgi:triosephosphate isomerase